MRRYADLRISDPSQYERIKKKEVQKYREEGWGNPDDPIKRDVADSLIEKKDLRRALGTALRAAELDVETAYHLRYNILTTRERLVASLIERLERLGFEGRARSLGEGRDRIEVRGPAGEVSVDAEDLDRFFTAAPRATAAQLQGFLARGRADAAAMETIAAKQHLLSLKETLGLPVEERPDGSLIVGAGRVFASASELLSAFVAGAQVERVALLIPKAGAEVTRRFHFETTDSTMTQALELAQRGAPNGTVVTAGFQTAGQGRMNRTWYCPPGRGMMMSYLHRHPALDAEDHIRIQFAASLAALRALADYGVSPRIKWPNDVYLGDRKVAGIKVDQRQDFQIIGVGVNVNTDAQEFPGEIREIATSLRAITGHEVPLKEFEDAFIAHLEKALEQDGDRIFADVDAHALYRPGDSVSVVLYDPTGARLKTVEGTVVGIDRRKGDLLVRETSTGQIQPIPEENERVTIRRIG
jgi:biotin-[acetyl-CoA-carboxylase] ligase BirA-like protein